MIRIILSTLIGAAFLFIWGFVSWDVLTWHVDDFSNLPDNEANVAYLESNLPTSGVYWFPPMPPNPGFDADADQKKAYAAAREVTMEAHRTGPSGILFYHAEGRDPMQWQIFARGFGFNAALAFIVSLIVWFSRKSATNFFARYFVILLIAGITPIYSDLMLWNWMFYHDHFTITNALDKIIGVAIMGLPIALIVRDRTSAAHKISEKTQATPEPSRPI